MIYESENRTTATRPDPREERTEARRRRQGASFLISPRAVAARVLDTVGRIPEEQLSAPRSAEASIVFRPRLVLGIITYCYAIGLYSSQDIEQTLREHTVFKALCDCELPDWHFIRRFRRNNREAIQACLAAVLSVLWKPDVSGPTGQVHSGAPD